MLVKAEKKEHCVIPNPLMYVAGEDDLKLSDDVEIIFNVDEVANREVSDLILAEMGDIIPGELHEVNCQTEESLNSSISFFITQKDGTLGEEGYELTVGNGGVEVRGGGAAGLYYGWMTLRLLILTNDEMCLPCCRIADKPRFVWRGFMLDSSRMFQPVERVKRILDLMSCLKLNVFHWHLTDDQVWTIESKKFPKLSGATWWRNGGEGKSPYYTQDEIRDIIAYANQRFIKVIPEIEMPGHCNCVLAEFPQYSCVGKPKQNTSAKTDTPADVKERLPYCIGKTETIEFLKEVLTEVAELFEYPVIHLGGDERPPGMWTNCPHCRALQERLGLDDEDKLQNWFMNHMSEFVHNELGCRTMAWAENLKDGCPEGQIVQGWRGTESQDALALGAEVVNSLNDYTYFDYPQTQQEAEVFCDWMLLLNLEKVYQFEPVPDRTPPEKVSLVLGSEAPLWTPFVPDEATLYHQIMPRLAGLAEVVWSAKDNKDFEDFQSRLPEFRKILAVINLWPEHAKPDFSKNFPTI